MTTFVLTNEGETLHHLQLVRIPDGTTFEAFQAALAEMAPGSPPPAWFHGVGGVNPPPFDAPARATVMVERGSYAVLCLVDTPDRVPHVMKGMMQPLRVTPAPLPEADLELTLVDYAFSFSEPPTESVRTIRVRNTASQDHEIVLVRLLPGKTMDDLGAWAMTYEGPPPFDPVGGAPAIRSGRRGARHLPGPEHELRRGAHAGGVRGALLHPRRDGRGAARGSPDGDAVHDRVTAKAAAGARAGAVLYSCAHRRLASARRATPGAQSLSPRSPLMSRAALALAFALAAPTGVAAQDFYTDVRPVLVESCMGCHTDEGIGWSMEDAEATYEERRMIARAVTAEVMPPWLAEPGHQEYLDDLSLDADVIAMVAEWRDAGYPKGDPRPDPARGAASFAEFAPDVSSDILPGRSYLPAQDMDDDYRCFVVDWNEPEPVYVTGFRAVPGNANVAHHVVVHVIEPGMIDRFREIDEETEGGGYECFGGALPTSFDWDAYEARYDDGRRDLANSEWWLTHWAPGMYGHRFPEDTGILVRPGSGLVVQMHYYTKEAPGESDAGTRVEFETTPSVERPGFMLVQTRNDWLESERNGSMVIPAGEMATYSLTDRLGDYVGYAAYLADVDRERVQGFEIWSANLHMHAHGHSGDISLTHPSGRTETLLSIPKWNLHWQRDFGFVAPKVFARDELDDAALRLRCTYANGTDQTVYGGYGSFDEMCFNMSYVAIQLGERAADRNGSRQR